MIGACEELVAVVGSRDCSKSIITNTKFVSEAKTQVISIQHLECKTLAKDYLHKQGSTDKAQTRAVQKVSLQGIKK